GPAARRRIALPAWARGWSDQRGLLPQRLAREWVGGPHGAGLGRVREHQLPQTAETNEGGGPGLLLLARPAPGQLFHVLPVALGYRLGNRRPPPPDRVLRLSCCYLPGLRGRCCCVGGTRVRRRWWRVRRVWQRVMGVPLGRSWLRRARSW